MSEATTMRTITIDAEVEREFDPDLFKLTIEFQGEYSEWNSCMEAYNADLAKVKAALVDAGIQPDEIKNSEFEITVHYDWLYEKVDNRHDYYRRVSRIVEGYEYGGDCTVERRIDNDLLKRIWSALQEIDGGFSYGIDYSLERPDECEKAILKEAVAETRSRAETLTDAAGAKLGNVMSVHHRFRNASVSSPPDAKYCTKASCEDICDLPSSAMEFNPETIEVWCNVSVAWAIE